jgi:hypothetical protein
MHQTRLLLPERKLLASSGILAMDFLAIKQNFQDRASITYSKNPVHTPSH